MTSDERRRNAAAEIATILDRYGCSLEPQVIVTGYKIRELLPVLQVEPEVTTRFIVTAKADWQPPDNTPAETLSTNVDSDNPD